MQDDTAYTRQIIQSARQFAQDLSNQNEQLSRLAAELECRKVYLEGLVAAQEKELDEHHKERVRLQKELSDAARGKYQISVEYAELQRRYLHLAEVHITGRLGEASTRQDVLTRLREATVHLTGAEKMAVFAVDGGKSEVTLIDSIGIDPEGYRSLSLESSSIGRALRTRRLMLVAPSSGGTCQEEPHNVTCIPLSSNTGLTGGIVLFDAFKGRTVLEGWQTTLLDRLAELASRALSRYLHAHSVTGPRPASSFGVNRHRRGC